MEKEDLHNDSKSEQEDFEEQTIAADDLKFMRSVIEKTCGKIDPGWSIMITWGLILMVGFPLLYFLKIHQLDNWLWHIQWLLVVIGFSISIYFITKAIKRERKAGVISKLSRQIYWIFIILSTNGIIWTCIDLFRDHVGGFGFLWTAICGFELSMVGILYSREWLYGGIAIFAGIVAAYFIEPCAYVILGIVTGLACIIPAIISHRNYREQEKENAYAQETRIR
jgi:hypothetical protein